MNNPPTNTFAPRPARKKVFDIVPPGKSMASPSSRPIIISDKPAVKDEQMISVHSAHGASVRAGNPNEKRPLMRGGEKRPLNSVSIASEAAANAVTVTSAPPLEKPSVTVTKSKEPVTLIPADIPEPEKPEPVQEVAPSAPELAASAPEVAGSVDSQTEPGQPPQSHLPIYEDDDEDAALFAEVSAAVADKPITPISAPELPKAASKAASAAKPQPIPEPAAEKVPAAELDLGKSTVSASEAKPKDEDAIPEAFVQPTYRREDLLSGAGMVMPEDEKQSAVVSQHRKHRLRAWHWIVIIGLVVVLGLTAFNFLIDAELVQNGFDIPTTNLL
jgi:hypothetical protein